MKLPGHQVAGRNVVGYGILLAPSGSVVSIRPFIEFDSYELRFEVEFDDNATKARSRIVEDADNPSLSTLILNKKWSGSNNITSNRGLEFAANDLFDYFIAYTFETIGTRDDHLMRLTFNTFARPRG